MKISDQNWPKKPIIETSLIFCLFFSVVSVIALIKASRFSSDSILAIRRISFSFLLIITRLIFLIDWSFVISALPEVLWPWNLKNPDLLNASAKEAKMTMISIKFILEVFIKFWCVFEWFQNQERRFLYSSTYDFLRECSCYNTSTMWHRNVS